MQVHKALISFILVSLALGCWYLVYLAKDQPYDLNLGLFFLCLVLSTTGSLLSLAVLISIRQKRGIGFLIFA